MRFLTPILIALGLVVAGLLWINSELNQSEQERQASLPIQANPARKQLPDFSAIANVTEKKRTFFGFLKPKIEQQNAKIAEQRAFVEAMRQRLIRGSGLERTQLQQLEMIALNYGFEPRQVSVATLDDLLVRVDTLPPEMVMVQAANETGWGSSRFAREGLNFFGQWCFKAGCGLVPLSRDSGRNHEVAKFDSVDESVASYLKNLNTNAAYAELRQIRAELRQAQMPVTAASLIPGLIRYSERQQDYVDELLVMLDSNQRFM
ncbi:glucosaminidase domain-containing protein [Ferrimonas aestuarii]|uniref:Glucosaminidase n=1 Tax=Ferrimonas aestuarii TaxID=2569539 RepID=A0A4U1BRQ5_9GAMM|nr:glucosaminidase domain-containing protein [Ferrimonas aestuarii]TKB57273.1 glucosaminidase [Ferrimonas aestuarii]